MDVERYASTEREKAGYEKAASSDQNDYLG